jgi:hypothetical protein
VNRRLEKLQGLERLSRGPRMSRQVLTPVLIAAGLVGTPLVISAIRRAQARDEASNVDEAAAYPMNHFLPGAGYYHAPYHAWFPMPFNQHDPNRGWFRGGKWRGTAQEDEAERAEEARASGVAPRGGYGGRVMTSRPNKDAVRRANTGAATYRSTHVTRGGFGFSSRHSGS